MHLQAAVEDFDVFARSLSIGPETMVMKFRPDLPMHDRYAVAHDFLSPEVGEEVLTISRLVNAFFRWEFNSCECLVRGDQVHPIDYANASPGRRADQPPLLLPVGDQDADQVVHVLHGHRPAPAAGPRHPPLLRGRRPRGPELRGEAGRLPGADRRVLRGRALPRLLRQPPGPRRRAGARVGRLGRLRPAAGRDGARDLSRRTSTTGSSRTCAGWSASGSASRARSRPGPPERGGRGGRGRCRANPGRARRGPARCCACARGSGASSRAAPRARSIRLVLVEAVEHLRSATRRRCAELTQRRSMIPSRRSVSAGSTPQRSRPSRASGSRRRSDELGRRGPRPSPGQ